MSGHDGGAVGPVSWENYSHQQMWNMVVSANPASIAGSAQDMHTLAQAMENNAEQVRRMAAKLLSTWSGAAAEQAADVLHPVLDWATRSATTASEISARLGRYSEAINTARLHMPAPVDYQQVNAVADDSPVVVRNLSLNEPEVARMAQGDTATAAQAADAKDKAVKVMRTFERQSTASAHGMPTFTTPPKVGPREIPVQPPPPVTLPPPGPPTQPDPPIDPHPPVQPEPPGTTDPNDPNNPNDPTNPTDGTTQQSTTTSLATVGPHGVIGGLGAGGGLGGVGGVGVGSGLGAAGTMSAGGTAGAATPGLGAFSGAGALDAAEEERMAAMTTAEAAEGGGWNGFGPTGRGGGRSGDQDGEHHDRYAGKPDLVGQLPPAYPPVLGL